ncbi:Maf family protein [Salibacterium aidingense]|uniref:Maf family protein n=1 Tax=Salibacterium aidingense TaxID=384933 RepID=UPI003BE83AB6
MPSLILASKSPRRKELLGQAGYRFRARPSRVSERLNGLLRPEEAVEALASQKAEEVYSRHSDGVVLGADTLIAHQHEILGKPGSKEEAEAMLGALSGQTHEVFTGVALYSRSANHVFHVKTEVTFYPLERWQISSYLSTSEPYDKAGAYGIQGQGCLFVESIAGDYYNVMGLPISRLSRELQAFHIFPFYSTNFS